MISLAPVFAALALASPQEPVSMPVELASSPAPLHGTLLQPTTGVVAVAVVIPGSGPTDRDGNTNLGPNGNLRMLAEGLATHGIATLRIDKRGIAQSAAAGGAEGDLRFDAYVQDAIGWATRAAQLTGHPCAWIIGHSEGALVALAAASEGGDRVCGVIHLAGAGRPAADVVAEQFQAGLPEPLLTPGLNALTELAAGRTVTGTPPQLDSLFRASVQPYLISWFAYDPRALIAAYEGPVLVAQGDRDIQVPVTDAQGLAAAQPNARLILWDGVSHLLKPGPEDRAANMATYADPNLQLDPRVVPDVAGFILNPPR